MRCIICVREKTSEELTTEHVFPYAIGGSLTTCNVCKPCNDTLGRTVDAHLSDNWLIQGIRLVLGIAGHGGCVPNPLERGTLDGKPGQKLVYMMDDDGNPEGLYLVPHIERRPMPDGREEVKISIDRSDLSKLPAIVNKIRTRKGLPALPDTEVLSMAQFGQIVQPKMLAQAQVDVLQYKRALLKIVYELAAMWLGTPYLDDPSAASLRACMLDEHLDADGFEKYGVRGTIDLVGSVPHLRLWDHDPWLHIGLLTSVDSFLYCCVRIFSTFEACVRVSEHASAYPGVVGQFVSLDPRSRTHEEMSFQDALGRLVQRRRVP